jgi:hypothetical protein
MRKSLTQSLSIGCISLAIATGLLPFAPDASARTLARAQGRCKLTSQNYQAFNGHCTVRQRQQQNGTTAFLVELDNGSSYRFFGRNKQSLQVETHEGVHNVRYSETPDKGVFEWQDQGNNNRLSVKIDSQQVPNANHDTPTNQSASTTIAEVVVGSLITSLLGGNTNASSPVSSSNHPSAGTAVASLRDLVGARAGQAENTVKQRGYSFLKGGEPGYTYWREGNTGYCVTIRTEDGRYQSLAYASPFDCQ